MFHIGESRKKNVFFTQRRKVGTGLARGRPPIKKVVEANELVCVKCGEYKIANFYKTPNKLFEYFGRLPWCKSCIEKLYLQCLGKYGNEVAAMYYFCRKLNIVYAQGAYNGAKNDSEKRGISLIASYFKQINGFRDRNNYGDCFEDSDSILNSQDEEINKLLEIKESYNNKKSSRSK